MLTWGNGSCWVDRTTSGLVDARAAMKPVAQSSRTLTPMPDRGTYSPRVYTRPGCTDSLSVRTRTTRAETHGLGVCEAVRANGDYHSNARGARSNCRKERTRSHNALEPNRRDLPIRAHFAAGNCRHSAFSARAPGRCPGAPGPIERLCDWTRRGRRPVGCVVGKQSRSRPWPRRIPGTGPHRPSGAPSIRRATRKSARRSSLSGWLRLRGCRRWSAPAWRSARRGNLRAVLWVARLRACPFASSAHLVPDLLSLQPVCSRSSCSPAVTFRPSATTCARCSRQPGVR